MRLSCSLEKKAFVGSHWLTETFPPSLSFAAQRVVTSVESSCPHWCTALKGKKKKIYLILSKPRKDRCSWEVLAGVPKFGTVARRNLAFSAQMAVCT